MSIFYSVVPRVLCGMQQLNGSYPAILLGRRAPARHRAMGLDGGQSPLTNPPDHHHHAHNGGTVDKIRHVKKRISPHELALALRRRRMEARKEEGQAIHEKNGSHLKDVNVSDKKHKQTTTKHVNKTKQTRKQKQLDDVTSDADDCDGSSLDMSSMRNNSIYKEKQNYLIEHVKVKLGGNDNDIDLSSFRDIFTVPSVIGVSTSDIDERIEALYQVGFDRSQVGLILSSLPFCVDVDYKEIRESCELLEQYDVHWNHFLNKEHVMCLIQSSNHKLRENLENLKDLGLASRQIKNLLKNFPILFTCTLSKNALKTISITAGLGFNSQWIEATFNDALSSQPVKVSAGPNTKELTEILKQFTINPNYIMRRYPSFFNMEAVQLYAILKVMSGKPLYLDTPLISSIITACPHEIATIDDHRQLGNHLNEINQLLSPVLPSIHSIINYFNRVPSLINPKVSISKKIALMERHGFTLDQIRHITTKIPSILVQDEMVLEQRLNLLLTLKDSSPTYITAASTDSTMFLKKKFEEIASRYNYTCKHQESLLHIDNIHKLFSCTDWQFSSLFNVTPIEYLQEAKRESWLDGKSVIERISRIKSRKRKLPKFDTHIHHKISNEVI